MAKMKICCLCFSPKTGTVILGCLGILISILSLIPHCAMMENHEFYIREFVKQQRATGGKHYLKIINIKTIKYCKYNIFGKTTTFKVLALRLQAPVIVAFVLCPTQKHFYTHPPNTFSINTIIILLVAPKCQNESAKKTGKKSTWLYKRAKLLLYWMRYFES